MSSFYPISKNPPVHERLARDIHKIILTNLMRQIADLPAEVVLDVSQDVSRKMAKRKRGVPVGNTPFELLCHFYMVLHSCSVQTELNRGIVSHGIDMFKARDIGFRVTSGEDGFYIHLNQDQSPAAIYTMNRSIRTWLSEKDKKSDGESYKNLPFEIVYQKDCVGDFEFLGDIAHMNRVQEITSEPAFF